MSAPRPVETEAVKCIEVDDIVSPVRFRYDTEKANGKLQSIAANADKGKCPRVRITTTKDGRYLFYASCVTGDDPPRAHATHLVGGRSKACLQGVFQKEFSVCSGTAEFDLDCGVQCTKKEKAVKRYEEKLLNVFGSDGQPLVPPKTSYKVEQLGAAYFEEQDINKTRLYYSLFYISGNQKIFVGSKLSNVLTSSVNVSPDLKITAIEPSHVPVTGGSIIMLTTKFKKKSLDVLLYRSDDHKHVFQCQVLLHHYNCALHVKVPHLECMQLDFSMLESCPEILLYLTDGTSRSEPYPIKVTKLDSGSSLASKRLRFDYQSCVTSGSDRRSLERAAASSSSSSGASAASSVLVHHAQPRPVTNFAPARVAMPRQVLQSVPSSQASQPFDSCTLPKSGNVAYTEANTQPSTSVTNNGADLFVTDDLQSPDASSLLNLDFESILTDNDNEQESQPDCGDLLDFVLGLR